VLSLSDIVNVKVGIGRGVFEAPGTTVIGGKKPSFNLEILKLFANGEQGFWYDPNDLTTMWQDQAKLLPVTGEGQPVWHILDKSGNNNHAFATSSATRPILRQNAITGAYYLEFDGSDDFLRTNNIDFTATDKVSVFAGVRKLSDAASGIVCELSTNSFSADGSFYLATPVTTSPPGTDGFNLRGTTAINRTHITISPASVMYTASGDIGNKAIVFRTNGVTRVSGLVDVGTGKLGSYPLYIGRRGGVSLAFNGHIYGLIGIGKLVSDNETANIEKGLAKRLGVTLNV
jgi:hypothetical protein